MNKIIATVAAAAVIGTSAIAGGAIVEEVVEPELTGFYLGAGYAYSDSVLSVANIDVIDGDNNGLALIAGYNINDFVAVEGRYTFIAEDRFTAYDFSQEDVDGTAWSIFVKPQYPVSDTFKVYALLGYGGVELEDSWGETIDRDGFQYGLGGAYSATKNVEIFADFVQAADGEITQDLIDMDTSIYTIGVNYKF